mmetsp:Transcript_38522/g.66537  ORF Transcript_38522/g.66537 Transcript_38522/m.66537 type:complete len:245 (-) Transcript_38522:843-1577(-)
MKAVYSVQVKYDMLVHHTHNLHQPCGRNNYKVISILRELRLLSFVYRSLRILVEYMMIPLGHPNLISPFFGSLRTSECHRDVKTPSARGRLLIHTAFTAPHAHKTHAHKFLHTRAATLTRTRTRTHRLHTYTHCFLYFEMFHYISSLLLPLPSVMSTLTPAPACTSSASMELQLLEFALLDGDVRAVPGRDPDLDDPERLPPFFSAETIRFMAETLLVVSGPGALATAGSVGGCGTGVCARLTG